MAVEEDSKFQTSIPKSEWLLSCKSLFASLSGGKGFVQSDIILKELLTYKSHLNQGLNIFQQNISVVESNNSGWNLPYDSITENEKQNEEKKTKLSESILLINKISGLINLKEETSEKILISYFQYEFLGNKIDVDDLLSNTNKHDELVSNVILYYIHERSFLIKCWKLILSYIFDKDSCYYSCCKNFIENDKNELYTFFIKQIDNIKENVISTENCMGFENVLKHYLNQCLNTHIDILQCLMYVTEMKSSIGYDEIKNTLLLFKESSVGSNIVLNYKFVNSTFPYDLKEYISYMYCLHLVQLITENNTSWNSKVFNEIFNEIKTLNIDKHPVLVPIVYLAWMIFLIKVNFIDDEDKLYKFSVEIFQLKPWEKLNTMLTSDLIVCDAIFQKLINCKVMNLLVDVIHHCFVTILDFECEEVYKLVANLSIDAYSLSDLIENEDVYKIIRHGLDMFPGKNSAILNLYIPLMNESKSNCSKVLEDLLKCTYFNWKSVDVPLRKEDDKFFNQISFSPFQFVQGVVIPCGTQCKQSDSAVDYYQWDINISLWHIMLEEFSAYYMTLSNGISDGNTTRNMSCLSRLDHTMVPHQEYLLPSLQDMLNQHDDGFRSRIILYLRLTSVVVKYPHLLDPNIEDILAVISKIFELNASRNDSLDIEILGLCIDISRNMFPGVTMLYNQVSSTFPILLPTPDVENAHEILSTGRFLNGKLLKKIFTNVAFNRQKYDLLISYIQFLSEVGKSEHCNENSTYTSGVLFIALEVLPYCLNSWIFEHEKLRLNTCRSCLKLIHDFLNKFDRNTTKSGANNTFSDNLKLPSYQTIVKSVIYSILEGESGVLILEISSLGENFLLNSFQETVSNGSTKHNKMIDSVHYSLAIICRVLCLKHEMKPFQQPGKSYVLESDMCNKGDFIKNIISYHKHVLKPNLRILSIKLLTRIAENKNISITIGSELNSETVRSIWLQPLFSQTESPEYKIALLQFSLQCLETQATLAFSLLNVEEKDSKKKKLLDFISDYLKQCNTVDKPLYYWVLAIVHTIWKQEIFLARQFLTNDPQFWTCLCTPLNAPPISSVSGHVYSPIFNIISTEIYWMSNDTTHALFPIIENFFKTESNLKTWSKLCTSLQLYRNDNFDLFHQLSISWQEFIIIVCKYKDSACNKAVKNIIATDVLNSLVEHLKCIEDNRNLRQPLHSLCNLYLIILNYWGDDCFDCPEDKLDLVCNIIILLEKDYDQLSLKTQILLIAVASKLFNTICTHNEQFTIFIRENTLFLNALCLVFSYSLEIHETLLVNQEYRENNENTQLMSVIVPLIIKVQSILSNDNQFWINNLLNENIFYKTFHCISQSIKVKHHTITSSFLIEYMIQCIIGNNYFQHLDKSNLISIIDEMIPETSLEVHDKNQTYLKNLDINYVYTNENYNMFYNQFVNLLTVVVLKGDHQLKEHVFNFVIINHDSVICLLKYCGLVLTQKNLNFVLSCLNLILHMTNYRTFIKSHTKEYFIKIIRRISVCMNRTMQILETNELKIAQTIYPPEVFTDGLFSKLYVSKLKTESDRLNYCNALRILLLNIHKTCFTIFNKYNVEFGLVLTSLRIGYLPWEIHKVVPYVPCDKKYETDIMPVSDFTLLIKCIKSYLKLMPQYKDKEEIQNQLKVNVEMMVHLLINHSLNYLLNPTGNINQKHLLLRDIETNLSYALIDYIKKQQGITILPFTKHWSKSPSKYYNYSKMKIPTIKLKCSKSSNALTWGDDRNTSHCMKKIVFDDIEEDISDPSGIAHDIEYMQFMVQVFSQICSLASSNI